MTDQLTHIRKKKISQGFFSPKCPSSSVEYFPFTTSFFLLSGLTEPVDFINTWHLQKLQLLSSGWKPPDVLSISVTPRAIHLFCVSPYGKAWSPPCEMQMLFNRTGVEPEHTTVAKWVCELWRSYCWDFPGRERFLSQDSSGYIMSSLQCETRNRGSQGSKGNEGTKCLVHWRAGKHLMTGVGEWGGGPVVLLTIDDYTQLHQSTAQPSHQLYQEVCTGLCERCRNRNSDALSNLLPLVGIRARIWIQACMIAHFWS